MSPPRLCPKLDRKNLLGLGALFGFIALSWLVFDRPIHSYMMTLDPVVRDVFRLVTEIGDSTWSIGAGLLLTLLFSAISRWSGGQKRAIARRLTGMAGFFLVSVLFSGISVSLIKNMIGRARPNTFDPARVFEFSPFSFDAAWASFPSGHSTTAMTVAVALALLWPRLTPFWLLLGVFGALSRVILGVHWPSDAIAGSAYGAICTLWVAQGFANRGWVFTGPARCFSWPLMQRFFR
jgi:membrane-associated phospholipid phosphatase